MLHFFCGDINLYNCIYSSHIYILLSPSFVIDNYSSLHTFSQIDKFIRLLDIYCTGNVIRCAFQFKFNIKIGCNNKKQILNLLQLPPESTHYLKCYSYLFIQVNSCNAILHSENLTHCLLLQRILQVYVLILSVIICSYISVFSTLQ